MQAFRPGNVDLDLAGPAATDVPNPGLNMPDLLADPLEIPALDESLFNTQAMDIDIGGKDTDALNWTSQVFTDPLSTEQPRHGADELGELYNDDLDIDIDGPSIEKGRDAQLNLSAFGDSLMEEGKLYDDDLGLALDDIANPQDTLGEQMDDLQLNIDDTLTVGVNGPQGQRDSQSPLSNAPSDEFRDFDETTMTADRTLQQTKQPAKKRKVLQMDSEIVLSHSEIKSFQENRSAILKPKSFLPRDPVLLALMNMHKNGTLVSNLMSGGRAKGWAPELRGILSIEVVRKSGALKRKRDGEPSETHLIEQGDMPQLEIPDDDGLTMQDQGIEDLTRNGDSGILDIPADGGLDIDNADTTRVGGDFDDTMAPLVPPEEQGAVSLGTQHAVHLLRTRFGGSAEASPQSKSNVLFQHLLPEAKTSKADATKMFFEVLVLATKDAVKVEQTEGQLGAPIRIRAKRGLWGAWAEREAGGEIEEEEEETRRQQAVPMAA